jgi:hypothetical protein
MPKLEQGLQDQFIAIELQLMSNLLQPIIQQQLELLLVPISKLTPQVKVKKHQELWQFFHQQLEFALQMQGLLHLIHL